ncbi:MAG: HAD family phosphatase [Gammaproteobacteria bacterium]|nr:HAD family phosphatase [Gammaproteobacteria bacterium]
MKIKNIIFDLGGVIIDIDYKKTYQAFSQLGATHFDHVYSQAKQENYFDLYETGKMSNETFRKTLQERLNICVSDDQFDNAWNAMLGALPKERLEFIKTLKNDYHVFLFSNTNNIHLKKVFEICFRDTGLENFDGLFHKAYYSHLLGHRKPNREAFIHILDENKLDANETLFVDDSPQHLVGASSVGIHTMLFTKDMQLIDIRTHINKGK